MARDARLTLEVPIESPELALVDPTVRALVLQEARPVVRAESEPEETVPAAPFGDDTTREALRRLTEVAEIEPATRPRRSPTIASLAFAVLAWGTLALILAELQPWRA